MADLGPGLRHAIIVIEGFPISAGLVCGIVPSIRGGEFVDAAGAPQPRPPAPRPPRRAAAHLARGRGFSLFVIVRALNIVGDAFRDLVDPRTYSH